MLPAADAHRVILLITTDVQQVILLPITDAE